MSEPENRWQRALGVERDRWRSLEELVGDPAVQERLAQEFPEGSTDGSGFSRRKFLRLLGASAALATAACNRPTKDFLFPYTRTPHGLVPGKPMRFCTSMVVDGFATGLVGTSIDGHPIKLDGNPAHPASLGGSLPREQAALLQLYDPMRAKSVLQAQAPSDWDTFRARFLPAANDPTGGAELRLLLEPTSSLLAEHLLNEIRARLPKARIYFHAPFETRAPLGIRLATGQLLQPRYDFSRAAVVLSLGADLVSVGPMADRYARDIADRRRVTDQHLTMSRLYAVESPLTSTGITADHRLALPPLLVAEFTRALVGELLARGGPEGAPSLPTRSSRALRPGSGQAPARDELYEPAQHFLRAVARDLSAHRGSSVVAVDDHASPEMHALAHAANDLLGNVGETVLYAPSPVLEIGEPSHDFAELVTDLESGDVERLLILGGNPVYTAPAGFPLAPALAKVEQVAYLGLYENETTAHATWMLPQAHFLETWDDARALDGTVSFVQPLIDVLFGGRPAHDLLAMLAGEAPAQPYERLRRFWSTRLPATTSWDEAIQRGLVEGSAFATTIPRTRWNAIAPLLQTPREPAQAFELSVRPDPKVYDGRFANNPWLQELPEPMTTQTWGNAAWVSPKTAATFRIETGDHVQVSRAARRLEIPVLVLPGHADGAVTIAAGYGRQPLRNGELNAVDVGANGFLVGDGPVTLEKVGRSERLALTQEHWSMEGRDLALSRTLPQYRRDPHVRGTDEKIFTLYHQPHPPGPQWAMAIDLTSCTGCSACVVACVAENNIPMVGKDGVLTSREMQWLRIDRYFGGKPDRPLVEVQPMLCQQCERAPCEYVCPVNATTHSTDGINEMTYNRCIGTRFCSNNCPYKVRRFNFFNYNAMVPPSIELSKNPEVTVRARGVMEKCTFCVQRIRVAQINSQLEKRPLEDGEIQTACEEACPTRAITFGDMTDETSRVSKLIQQGRAYQALQEIGTVPRVRYLARLRNVNPEIG